MKIDVSVSNPEDITFDVGFTATLRELGVLKRAIQVGTESNDEVRGHLFTVICSIERKANQLLTVVDTEGGE